MRTALKRAVNGVLRSARTLRWWRPIILITLCLLLLAILPMIFILVSLHLATTATSLARRWRDVFAFVPLAMLFAAAFAAYVFVVALIVEIVRQRRNMDTTNDAEVL